MWPLYTEQDRLRFSPPGASAGLCPDRPARALHWSKLAPGIANLSLQSTDRSNIQGISLLPLSVLRVLKCPVYTEATRKCHG